MPPSLLNTVTLACLLAAGCAAPGGEPESQPAPAVERGSQTQAVRPVARPEPPVPQLVADLSPRRIKGRQQLDLGSGRTLHADRLKPQADGTTLASGDVYVDGGAGVGGSLAGWPRHGHAEQAVWRPVDGTLELRGWPAMEYSVGRIVATDAETVFFLSASGARAEGPSATGMH